MIVAHTTMISAVASGRFRNPNRIGVNTTFAARLIRNGTSTVTAAARAIKCRGNLRDLGVGLRFYADEFGAYPTGSLTGVLLQDSSVPEDDPVESNVSLESAWA
jgi:hypothetical protein